MFEKGVEPVRTIRMNRLRLGASIVAVFAAACGGGGQAAPKPGDGTNVATLSLQGAPLALSFDGSAIYAIVFQPTSSPQIAVDRVDGSEVTAIPIAVTDLSDYVTNNQIGINPTKTALVSASVAYFLGVYGVTVVPLDSSPSSTLYVPAPGSNSTTVNSFNAPLGSFIVDSGSIYVCDYDFTTNSTNFGRFNQDGTWDLLFTGDRPAQDESCSAGAMAVDASAVYWSTTAAIRAYGKADGTVRTVVALEGLSLAPPLLAAGGGSVAWFDWFDAAFHVASVNGTTPDTPAALGATTRLQLAGSAPTPFSLLSTAQNLYWLTPYDLHRLPIDGGPDDVLASRSTQTDAFIGLAADSQTLYFTDWDPGDGGLGDLTVRAVGE